jgi:hypothetical protein
MPLVLPTHLVYHNGVPTDPVLVLHDLQAHGLPDDVCARYLLSAVPFFNPNHEPAGSSEGGRFAPQGGGGGTTTSPAARTAGSAPDLSEVQKNWEAERSKYKAAGDKLAAARGDLDKAIAVLPPERPQPASIAGRLWRGLTDGVAKFAAAASNGISTLAAALTHAASYAGAGTYGILRAAAAAGGVGGFGLADNHYNKLERNYGTTTANLIHMAGSVAAATLGAAAMAGATYFLMKNNPSLPLLKNAIGGATLGSFVGAAFKDVPFLRDGLRSMTGMFIANKVFKATGMKTQDQTDADWAAFKSAKANYNKALGEFEKVTGKKLAVAEHSASFAAPSKDFNKTVNLPPEAIQKQGQLLCNAVLAEVCDKLFSKPDAWIPVFKAIKDGKIKKSVSLSYFNGQPLSYDDIYTTLTATYSEDDALAILLDLEPVLL